MWRVKVFSQVLFKGIQRRLHLAVACLSFFFTTKWYVSVLLKQRWTGYRFLQLLRWLSCCELNLTSWEPVLTWHSFECFQISSGLTQLPLCPISSERFYSWLGKEKFWRADRWMDKRIDWWTDEQTRICGQVNRLTDGWTIDVKCKCTFIWKAHLKNSNSWTKC